MGQRLLPSGAFLQPTSLVFEPSPCFGLPPLFANSTKFLLIRRKRIFADHITSFCVPSFLQTPSDGSCETPILTVSSQRGFDFGRAGAVHH